MAVDDIAADDVPLFIAIKLIAVRSAVEDDGAATVVVDVIERENPFVVAIGEAGAVGYRSFRHVAPVRWNQQRPEKRRGPGKNSPRPGSPRRRFWTGTPTPHRPGAGGP